MAQDELGGRMALASRVADAAREAILPHFRSGALGTENKLSDGYDPVTVADRAAEVAMRSVIENAFPHDGILGEEFPDKSSMSGITWVLDPIDGTRGFVSGTPTWGVLIAISDESGPLGGIIDQPYIGERFVGGPEMAMLDFRGVKTPLRVSKTKHLSDATVFTTFPEVGSETECNAFHAVARQSKLTRYGMDCYAYALLAAGQVDLVIEAGLNPYDIQAPIAVVQAAGGIVTDWRGAAAHDGGRALAASTPELHAAALEVLVPFLDMASE